MPNNACFAFLATLACIAICITCPDAVVESEASVNSASPADSRPVRVEVLLDCQALESEVPALFIGGKALVPVGALFGAMGLDVSWDSSSQTITAANEDTTAVISPGTNTALINGKTFEMDSEPIIVQGHILVPESFFILESFGYNYDSAMVWRDSDLVYEIYFGEDLTKAVDLVLSQIISPGMSPLHKEAAIHDYLVEHTAYNLFGKQQKSAYGVLVNGTGVCTGYAEAAKILLNRAGIECLIVTGTGDDGRMQGFHAWNMVRIDNQWYHLDVTWDDPDQGDLIKYDYFNMSDEEMARNHAWNPEDYPACDHPFPPGEALRNDHRLDGGYIYYSINYIQTNDGILYRRNLGSGNDREIIMRFPGSIDSNGFDIEDGLVYLSYRSRYENGLSLRNFYRFQIDGTKCECIASLWTDTKLENLSVKGEWISYWLGTEQYQMKTDGSDNHKVSAGEPG